MTRRPFAFSYLCALLFGTAFFGVSRPLFANETDTLPCEVCNEAAIFLDQGFSLNADSEDPAAQVPASLQPYFHQVVDTGTGEKRWLFDFGQRKLMVYNQAQISVVGSGVLPDLEIRTQCEVYVAEGSGFQLRGQQGGRFDILAGGEIRYDGFIDSHMDQTMTAIRLNSNCGTLITGSQSRVRTQGNGAVQEAVRLQTCTGNIFLAGSVEVDYAQGDQAGEVSVVALDGQIDIDGATVYEQTENSVQHASGIHIRSQGDTTPGRILVEAAHNLNVYGLGFPWKNEDQLVFATADSQGTLSIDKGTETHKGATVQLISKSGDLYLHDFAVDVANHQNTFSEVLLNAEGNITVANNGDQSPRVAIDGRGLGGDHNRGATLVLQSHTAKILLLQGTALDAGGLDETQAGRIQLTSCLGTYRQAQLTPAAEEHSDCDSHAPQLGYEYLSLAPTALPTAATGVAYTATLRADHSGGLQAGFRLVDAPAGVALDRHTGVLAWAAPTTGTHAVTVEAVAGCSIVKQVLTLDVSGDSVNQAPIFVSAPIQDAMVDTDYLYNVAVSDPDHPTDQLTVSLQQGPAGMVYNAAANALMWRPDTTQVGDFAVQLQVQDPLGATAQQTFTVTVAPRPNAAPEFTSEPELYGTAGQIYRYQATAIDPDGDALTFIMVNGPAGMTVGTNGLVSWTTDRDDAGVYAVTLEVRDPAGATDQQVYQLAISPAPNRAPTFTSTPGTNVVAEQTYLYQATAQDADGDTLTFTRIAGPDGLTIDATSGLVTWTTTRELVGDHAVTLAVNDGNGGSDQQTFTIAVAPAPNRAPAFTSAPGTNVVAEQTYLYQATAQDADGDSLTFTRIAGPDGLTIDATSGLVTWTTTRDLVGDHAVTLAVNDGNGGSDQQTFTITVAPAPNRAPAFTSTPGTNVVGEQTYQYQATAQDADGDTLTFTRIAGPDGLTIDATSGLVTWTTTRDLVGDHVVTLAVNDGKGGSDQQTFTIAVAPAPNRAPAFTSTPITDVIAEQNYQYQATAQDADGDTLTFTRIGGPEGLTIDAASGLVTWMPSRQQSGEQTVTLEVTDGNGGSDQQSFTILVTLPANQPPQITSTPVTSVLLGSAYAYQVTATDPDQDPLTFNLVAGPAGMSQDAESGLISWDTPNACSEGQFDITTRVSDPRGESDEQTFTLTLQREGSERNYTFVVDRAGNGQKLINETDETNNIASLTVRACGQWGEHVCTIDHTTPPAPTTNPVATGTLDGTQNIIKHNAQPGIDLRVAGFDRALEFVDPQTLERSGELRVQVENNGLHPFAGTFAVRLFEDQNANGRYDAEDEIIGEQEVSDLDGTESTWLTFTLSGEALFAGNVLYAELDTTALVSETDETNNLVHSGAYLAYRPPTGLLMPVLEWKWTNEEDNGEYANTQMAPLVVNVNDDNGDGLINETDVPDVLAVGGDCHGSQRGKLVALDGRNGAVLWSTNPATHSVRGCFGIAAGDLDGDGLIEIVALGANENRQYFMIFEHDGTFKLRSENLGEVGSAGYGDTNFTLADLNRDGTPEILFSKRIYNHLGQLIAEGPGDPDRHYQPVAVDLDMQGDLEVLYGAYAMRSDGSLYWDANDIAPEPLNQWVVRASVGNLDDDPMPEIILSGPTQNGNNGRIIALEHDGTLKWYGRGSRNLARGGGQATIADFDGDGRPEIGVAGRFEYTVLETDGSLKWEAEIVDASSGYTGSTVFDFDGDGRFEVVMSDEQFLYVFDGETGRTLFRENALSGTLTEYPVVADVDGDGRAEIITSSNRHGILGTPPEGAEWGIFVYGDRFNNWVNARRIWNQNDYSVTNVNDDGTIPTHPQAYWLYPQTNLYHSQISPGLNPLAAPDLTISRVREESCNCPEQISLRARIGNGGSATAPAGIPISVYSDVPAQGGRLLGVVHTSRILKPGEFEDIRYAATNSQCMATPPSFVSDPVTRHPQGEWYRFRLEADNPDGDTLTYQLVNYENEWLQYNEFLRFDETTHEVQIVPWALPGQYPIAVEVHNTRGGMDQLIWTVEIYDTGNVAPRITSEPITDAYTNIPYSYTVTAVDDNNHDIELTLVEGTEAMNLDPQTGELTWLPTVRLQRVNVTIEAHDGRGGRDRQFFTVITRNLSPVFVSEVPERVEVVLGESWSYQPEAIDPNGDAVRYSISYNNEWTYDADTNTVTYRPISRSGGGISVFADDPYGGRTTQSIRYTYLLPENNSPPHVVSTPPTQALVGQPFSYQIVAEDPDGDALHFTRGSYQSGLAVSPEGLLTWTPTQIGTFQVGATIDDYRGHNIRYLFPLEVIERTNETPTFTSLPENPVLAPGQNYQFQLQAEDADGDSLTFYLVNGPAGLTVDESGLLTWTAQSVGSYDVTVGVRDDFGAASEAGGVFVVNENNENPVFTNLPENAQVTLGQSYSYQLEASDADGDSLTFTLNQGPNGLTLSESGLIEWTPEQAGSFEVSLTVTDERGGFSQGGFSIAVVDQPNQTPVIASTPPSEAVILGGRFYYQLFAYDPDGDEVTLSLNEAPVGAILSAGGLLTWIPEELGTFRILLSADDGREGVSFQEITIPVSLPPNTDAPTIVSVPLQITRVAALYQYQAVAEDADGDPLTFSLPIAPEGMSIDATGGLLTWQSTESQIGDHEVTVRVEDDRGSWGSQTFSLRVTPNPNNPPRITSQPALSVPQDQVWHYVVTTDDADGDAVSISLLEGPDGMALSGDRVTWSPTSMGTFSVRLLATDNFNDTDEQAFTLTVTDALGNRAPTFTTRPNVAITVDQPWFYSFGVEDLDGDAVSIELTEAPEGMALLGQTLNWSPDTMGFYPVALVATDTQGAQTEHRFTLTVQFQGNHPPRFTSDPILTAQAGRPYIYDALVEDLDGYPIRFRLITGPSDMQLDRYRGILDWTPTINDVGDHDITLVVADAHQAEARQRYTLRVVDPGDIDPPIIGLNYQQFELDLGETFSFNVATPDRADIAFIEAQIAEQTISLDSDLAGAWVANVAGRVTLSVVARDAAGNQSQAEGTIFVRDPADTTAPLVAIHSPDRHDTATEPTNVVVSVLDDRLSHWTLDITRANETCWRTIAEGRNTLDHQVAAVLDTSLLSNGMYHLRLSAVDAGDNLVGDQVTVIIEGNRKAGRFEMGFHLNGALRPEETHL